jgi:hypothetical protein
MTTAIFNMNDRSIEIYTATTKLAKRLNLSLYIINKRLKESDHFYTNGMMITRNVSTTHK